MAIDTIELREEHTETEERIQLYIGGLQKAMVTRRKDKKVRLHLHLAGPFPWRTEGYLLVQGLMELAVIAMQMEGTRD